MKALRILAITLCVFCSSFLSPQVVRADPIPAEAHIVGLSGNAQRFTLSCEARSAVDWAAYWGVEIREKKFLNSLPRSDNPDAGFVGNPNDEWGNLPPLSYGVHAEPVAALLRQYGLQADARRGLSWDDLRSEIAAGRPVIVWVIGQMWRGVPVRYKAKDGHTTTVARYEHTMILIGYDPSRVYVVDAFSGQFQSYPLKTFLASWKTLGRMAIIGGGSARPALEVSAPQPDSSGRDKLTRHTFLPMVFRQPRLSVGMSYGTSNEQTYTVRSGDDLARIARVNGLDWKQLALLNGIEYPYVIYTGQVLRLR